MPFAFEKSTRAAVPELDKILGKPFKALDDGFVRVVDYMGSDASVVQAARVSYGEGTKQISQDRGLIRYLLRHRHTTPFEMCEIKLHVRVPMDIWRQWIRHRTASVNEYSTRYSIAIDAAHSTTATQWRTQTEQNKQGSGGLVPPDIGAALTAEEAEFHRHCREVYDSRIAKGIAREQARKDLPLSTYTEAYWKIDLHNLLHFLALRMEAHAQYEIRDYATLIGKEIVQRWVPLTWEAFEDYRFNATTLSKDALALLGLVAKGVPDAARTYARDHGLETLDATTQTWKPGRELRELEDVIAKMGLISPWTN